ncbi:MAG: CCA tRNA nucleotidyltransferase [Clostridiales bacterium]|nr:CCA tRNA nucleotidyltransferase [Clostridiales bacterium]
MSKKIFMPSEIKYVIERLLQNGYKAYIVGGCVRDSIMGIEPKDWDITTSATPDETMHVFFDHKVIPTGIKHGTVTVCIGEFMTEITTFRTENGYSDGRHPDCVSFVRDVKDDLMRRDFTVNAMAYNDKDGLIDHFGGCDDIENKIIRCVGDAETRFSEDALRILRALRFASVLGFEIESDTARAAKNLAYTLNRISKERICTELKKLITGKYSADIMKGFADILNTAIKSADFSGKADMIANCEPVLVPRLALLMENVPADLVESELAALRFEKRTINQVIKILPFVISGVKSDRFSVKYALYKLGFEDFALLSKALYAKFDKIDIQDIANEVILNKECYNISMLDCSGRDIIELGYKGAEISSALENALMAVMQGNIENNKNQIITYIKGSR